jgi:hypothetical protein
MNGFQAYKMYVALKNHFSSNTYDYFKYGGKTRASLNNYESRKDKYFFEKLARKRDVESFILANVVEQGATVWVGDLANEQQAEEYYRAWQKRQQSFTYMFKQDLNNILIPYDANFVVVDGQHPPLLKQYIRREVSIETLCVLNSLSNFTKYWSRKIEDKVIWPEIAKKIKKYTPFIHFDNSTAKQVVISFFNPC